MFEYLIFSLIISFLTSHSDDELKLSTRLFHTVVGHIGGVKDICFVPCPPTKEQAGKSDPNFHGYFVSSGSRTSLKFWRLSDNVVEFMDGTYNLYSNELRKEHEFSCSLLSEIYNPETKLKMLKLKDRTLIDDMRYLSCDAILLSSVYPDTGSLGNTLCCACACSDGVVRYVCLFLWSPVFCIAAGLFSIKKLKGFSFFRLVEESRQK